MKKWKITFVLVSYLLWLGAIIGLITACHVFLPHLSWMGWLVFILLIFIVNLWIAISIFGSKKWQQIAKTRWLFLVIFFPIFNFVFLCLFGFNRTKWSNKLNELVFKDGGDKLINSHTFMTYNQFKFIEKQSDSDILIVKLIRQAQESIVIQISQIDDEVFINQIMPLLIKTKAMKTKLDIYILYDLHVKISKTIIKLCQDNNIYLKCYKPKYIGKIFFNVLMTNSMLISDNKYALIGNSLWRKQDQSKVIFNYCVSGLIVQRLLKIFVCYWQSTINNTPKNDSLITLKRLCESKAKDYPLDHKISSQCCYCASYPHPQNIYNILLYLIYSARKSIKIVTNSFLPVDHLNFALEVALIKNVDVKIITSNYLSNSRMQICNYFNKMLIVNKNLYLLNNKIEYNFIVIDDELVIISPLDFNYSSLFLNPQTIVCLKDKKKYFVNKFSNLLNQTTLAKQMSFSKWDKFVFGCYNIFYPLFI